MESRQNRKLLRYQECRLERSGLRQSLNNAHEQRLVYTSRHLFYDNSKRHRVYHPISGDKPIRSLYVTFCIVMYKLSYMTSSVFCVQSIRP